MSKAIFTIYLPSMQYPVLLCSVLQGSNPHSIFVPFCVMTFIRNGKKRLFRLFIPIDGWNFCFTFAFSDMLLQSHSVCCTESFMRDNVLGELQQLQPDDESKQKMLDILKRLHSEDEEEEMDNMEEDGIVYDECVCFLLKP